MASRKSQDTYTNNDSIAQRRAFMKLTGGGCAALGSTSLLSQLMSLQLTGAAYANSGNTSTSGYKALVCIFLNGGMDTFDMLTPFEDAEWAAYNTTRLFAARPRANPPSGSTPTAVNTATNPELLPINVDSTNPASRRLGINGLMPELKTLYDQGDLAFVANIGSLIRPILSTADYNNLSNRPLGLFSHADLQQHWQTSVPQSRSQATGWAGRMADLLNSTLNPQSRVSMNVALGSGNLFQTGTSVLPYVVGSGGATQPGGYRFYTDADSLWTTSMSAADRIHSRVANGVGPGGKRSGTLAEQNAGLVNAMFPTADTATGALYSNLLQRTLALKKRASMDVADMFFDATNTTTAVGGVFPGTLVAAPGQPDPQAPFSAIAADVTINSTMKGLSANLNMVARVIQARSARGSIPGFSQNRQIFFVNVGGWDMHDNITTAMSTALPGLSKALKAFYDATVRMGVSNDVVTFSVSDFARTLNPNSTGTDHGWGGNQFVIGGSVAGGKVYGNYPTSLQSPRFPASTQSIDLGRGRLIPTTSVDVYNAELARWFGVPDSSLDLILPNIRNFIPSGTTAMPLGMLAAG
jgi:uncharacterized protein (DUF1501 family)